ncbi:hypothetical protein GW943_00095 [Candidatus Parcubacteria bacterium]|uniref:Uncharacterized protein n=1 Tax=Candidatus Kaiserbacteria bacterium CG10_big_fil_rev_8_21_14_0_10_47_16 TaxID=1974608 RepID=A0A2H0UCY4_9BACT|nr:hypothetical protein [Candidatus Parcubacteria bacterium]PIR84252.1 MAG: hypothetical protein COU16_01470 [Candidatus Kaiserbacteria bacterium CG10_big_fil_rev_8_21_14_0_10_47_16]
MLLNRLRPLVESLAWDLVQNAELSTNEILLVIIRLEDEYLINFSQKHLRETDVTQVLVIEGKPHILGYVAYDFWKEIAIDITGNLDGIPEFPPDGFVRAVVAGFGDCTVFDNIVPQQRLV